ncbi:MAG: sugar kinase [Chloroflexi bacterium]|nr:sugar kinase [Chloroflexota bacterium]
MTIVVVGSVALDNIETPAGKTTGSLGGASTFFAVAASLYHPVSMVGVVGQDFPQEHLDLFASRSIDLSGLQVVDGNTFSWSGRYLQDLDSAETLDTQLNVFADFNPVIPDAFSSAEYLMLANIDPDLQIQVLGQVKSPRLRVLDSMNYWITSKREALTRAIGLVDIVILNEGEVRLYTGENNLYLAAEQILALGPRVLVAKKGSNGSLLALRNANGKISFFLAPAYPIKHVVDPTGAGDCFAAGFVGYLARSGDLTELDLRRAVIHGAVVASFKIEDFSLGRLVSVSMDEIIARYDELTAAIYFDHPAEQATKGLSEPLII